MGIRFKSTDRVTLAGLPGTGKTTLTKYLASLCMPRVFIYDPLAQYTGFPNNRYIPKSDSLAEFDMVCKKLRMRGNIVFVIEEAERYLGQGKPLGENAFDLVNRGRNWGVGIIAVTRRIQRISKDYFDLCQHCFFFRCGLKSREYISDMVGKDVTRKIIELPEHHFLHYNIETEETSVHHLTLSAQPQAPMVEAEVKTSSHPEDRAGEAAKVAAGT